MTWLVLLSVGLGVAYGHFLPDSLLSLQVQRLTELTLALLLFSVGLDIGANRAALRRLGDQALPVLVVTLGTLAGSLIGGTLAALLIGMPTGHGLAVASGLGWYSLSGVILTGLGNPELGSIAFLSNVFRELITFIAVPTLAARLNALSAVGLAGATAMDTTLPLISRHSDSQTALVAFISGVLLSTLVPILVPLFYTLT